MALRDLILLLVVAGAVPVIFFRPWVGILFWYWVGLMNPHRLTWGMMYDFQLAMLVAVVTLAALVLTRDRKPPPMSREVLLIFALAGLFTVTSYHAWVPEAAWSYWDQVMKIFLVTLVTPMLIHGRRRVEVLVAVITLSVAFYGFKGGLFTLSTGGNYHVVGPSRSFITGNTNLGLALLMVMPLLLVLARQAREGRLAVLPYPAWSRLAGWGGYATFWLTGLATVFTYSRGALVGLATIGPFLFAKMRYKLVMAVAAVAAVAVVGVTVPDKLVNRAQTIQTFEEDFSAMQRIQAWGVNWNIARERPLTGAGFDLVYAGTERWIGYANFLGDWPDNRARTAHSNYFQVLGHHGFLGLGLYLALIASAMTSLARMALRGRGHPETAWISEYSWALLVGLIGYAVAGAFLDMAYFTLFYAFVALTIVLRREYSVACARIDEAEQEPEAEVPDQVGSGVVGAVDGDGRADGLPDFGGQR